MNSFEQVKDSLVYNMSDEQYHAQSDSIDEHFFSSSQLKKMMVDPYLFYNEYVKGEKSEVTQASQDNFDVGTYFHTYFLEPEKMDGQFATYSKTRRSKEWDAFKEENKDKIIMTPKMLKDADKLVLGVKRNDDCMELLKDIQSEVTICTELMGVKVKCRFDILNGMVGGDLKSTSLEALGDEAQLKRTIVSYGYDLSYALYRDIYEKVTGNSMDKFYWIFASKKIPRAKVVYAHDDFYRLGRLKYQKALRGIKELQANGWKYEEKVITLEPSVFDKKEYGLDEADLL